MKNWVIYYYFKSSRSGNFLKLVCKICNQACFFQSYMPSSPFNSKNRSGLNSISKSWLFIFICVLHVLVRRIIRFQRFGRVFFKLFEITSSVRKFHKHEFLHEFESTRINDLSISVLALSLKVERDPPIINEVMVT